MSTAATQTSLLSTRRGKLILGLLCAIAFIDFIDGSIINLALPSIRRALRFSPQDLVWVPSGYLLTYGGCMLLGGRAADLLGRRRILVAGTVLIGASSLGGARAIEHLRAVASELQIAHVRQQLSFSLFTDFENFSTFAPGPQHAESAVVLFDQLESWSEAMKTVRESQSEAMTTVRG
jgi:hypothetical protein